MSTDTQTPTQEPQLPALVIEVRGEVVTSNADAFIGFYRKQLEQLPSVLETDDDFNKARESAKVLKKTEDTIDAAEERALQEADQIYALLTTLRTGKAEIREKRLDYERKVKKRNEEIKSAIVSDAVAQIINGHGEKYRGQIAEAVKGKSLLASMREAVGVIVTTANALIDANRQLLAAHHEAHGNDLIPDRKALELTATPAQLTAELELRIERKKAEEARRKAEAEAAAARAELAEQKRKADEAEAAAKKAQEAPQATVQQPAAQKAADHPFAGVEAKQDATSPAVTPEWDVWCAAVVDALSPLKAAREQLTAPENKARAEAFARAVGAAYKEMAQ